MWRWIKESRTAAAGSGLKPMTMMKSGSQSVLGAMEVGCAELHVQKACRKCAEKNWGFSFVCSQMAAHSPLQETSCASQVSRIGPARSSARRPRLGAQRHERCWAPDRHSTRTTAKSELWLDLYGILQWTTRRLLHHLLRLQQRPYPICPPQNGYPRVAFRNH